MDSVPIIVGAVLPMHIKGWTGLTSDGIHRLSKDRRKCRVVSRVVSQVMTLLRQGHGIDVRR